MKERTLVKEFMPQVSVTENVIQGIPIVKIAEAAKGANKNRNTEARTIGSKRRQLLKKLEMVPGIKYCRVLRFNFFLFPRKRSLDQIRPLGNQGASPTVEQQSGMLSG